MFTLRSKWLFMLFGMSLMSSGWSAEKSTKTPALNCSDDILCTQEYAPTICRYKGKDFKGSNPCHTLKQARRYACENKLAFLEAVADCKPHQDSKTE